MFRFFSWNVLRLETFWQDVRYGARMLRRSPGFAAAAVLTFALGIGANTAIFSIVDAAILRPLPYDEPDRIVSVSQHNPQTGRSTTGMMPRDFLDWRERTDLFEHIALIGGGAFTLLGDGEPEELRVNRVTEGFFEMMRTQPMLGRAFTRSDEQPGRERVAILSHAFWKARFAAAPDVIGRQLRLNGQPYEIVGVLPERFVYPAGARRPTPIFLPLTLTGEDRQHGVIQSMAFGPTLRLKDGKAREEVEAALSQIQAAADPRKLGMNKGYTRVELTPLLEEYVGSARSWMLMLLGAVALVLLIACANVANLVLAHGTARVRELTVRGALGASRGRIARQLLAESLLLATVGAAAGLAVAWWGLGVLRATLPPGIPRASTIGMDLRVLGFTAAAAIATGLVCGLLPALQGSRLDLATGMKEGSGASVGTAGRRLRHVLAWVEVALAVMLLVGAGLFISSFARVLRVDYGFDARGVVTIDYGSRRLAPGEKPDLTYLPRMLDAARGVPGVEAALVTAGNGPFFGGSTTSPFKVIGRPKVAADARPQIRIKRVSPGFLEILRVPILRGRTFTSQDSRSGVATLVINESAARQFWPKQDPIGQRIEMAQTNAQQWEIVGVAGDVRYNDPTLPPVPEAFLNYELATFHGGGTLLLRAPGDASAIVPAIKAAIWAVNPSQTLTSVQSVDAQYERTTAARRFNMLLMAIFATLAVTIAATGIYGVIAFLVGKRTREIGVRIALGASPREVVALFLRQGVSVVLAGIAAGLIAAWWLSRAVQQFLFEVEPRDPLVFATVCTILTVVGVLASWLPARRAARVDPLQALRTE